MYECMIIQYFLFLNRLGVHQQFHILIYGFIVFVMTQIAEFTMSSDYNDFIALRNVTDYREVNVQYMIKYTVNFITKLIFTFCRSHRAQPLQGMYVCT